MRSVVFSLFLFVGCVPSNKPIENKTEKPKVSDQTASVTYNNPELTIETFRYTSDFGENKTIKVASCRGCHWKCNDCEK